MYYTFSSSESLVQSELAHLLMVQRRIVLGAQLLARLCDASRRYQKSANGKFTEQATNALGTGLT